jgi:hypothetical protein
MSKSLIATTAALALVSLGFLVSGSARAGGASSAASKYSNSYNGATNATYGQQARSIETSYTITEFSSSSAKTSAPKR